MSTWSKDKGIKRQLIGADTPEIMMKSNPVESLESRKIIKSWHGIIIASVKVFFLAICFGMSIVFFSQIPKNNLGEGETFLCWIIGLVPQTLTGKMENYKMVAFICYFIATLLQIYIPLRALLQPSFLAGKPATTVTSTV